MKLPKTYDVYSKSWVTITQDTISIEEITKLKQELIDNNLTIFRFYDGEWIWTLKIEPFYSNRFKKRTKNNPFFAKKILKVTSKLHEIINSNPEYYFSIDSYSLSEEKIKEKVIPYLDKIPNRIGAGVFSMWCIHTAFEDLFEIFKKRQIIVVGPEQMKNLPFKVDKHIITHLTDSIFYTEKTLQELEFFLSKNYSKDTVILYSCSFTAKICLDYFYKKYENISQLDMGNVLCPFVNMNIRPWHQTMNDELRQLKIIK